MVEDKGDGHTKWIITLTGMDNSIFDHAFDQSLLYSENINNRFHKCIIFCYRKFTECCTAVLQLASKVNAHLTCPIMTQQQPFRKLAQEAAVAIKMAIDTDPLRRLSIFEMVNDIQIGRNRLQSAFRVMTGMTIKRYRLQKRMELARDLLATGALNIKQVAFRCGYKNQSNFSTDYKAVFEIAPLDFVKNKK